MREAQRVSVEHFGFPFPVVTPRLIVTPMLRDEGPLMRLWRHERESPRLDRLAVDIGFHIPTRTVATIEQERVLANDRSLPA